MQRTASLLLILTSLLFSAAIFGFFYAWVCSTMWGLDQADPRVAIAAMQAMNASVRNGIFFPAFFLTPVFMALTAALMWRMKHRTSAQFFATGAAIYFCFGLILTMAINVPMNEALALIPIPDNQTEAAQIWADYAPTWQFWNQTRTIASGLSFLCAVIAVFALPPSLILGTASDSRRDSAPITH